MRRVAGLLRCSMEILQDGCPPDPACYLCRQQEAEEADCMRCWQRYVYQIANGDRTWPEQRPQKYAGLRHNPA